MDKYHGHYHYHSYRRSDRGYLLDEFKKVKPLTFDGEMKRSRDVESWLLQMNKFFRFHDYLENMKAKIVTFSLKGKEKIWWEYVKNVRGIQEKELTWREFERLFKKKYIFRDTMMIR